MSLYLKTPVLEILEFQENQHTFSINHGKKARNKLLIAGKYW